jgi:CubicO group peptidase (beta-lactamase class C family)
MADIQGTADPRFDRVVDLLGASIAKGGDIGAAMAVTIEGEPVVDVWGGWCDAEKTNPWGRDTITNVWSTTKTMLFVAALVLVEREELDLDAPVAWYWPEFAANGKAAITVKMLFGHTSGVSGWDQPVTIDDLYDWDRSTSMLAAQAPWWEPGTASGYHAINQGHLVGEVIRRITGRKPGQFFAEEVAAPLGADFHIGLDPSHHHRVAPVVAPAKDMVEASKPDPDSVAHRTLTGPRLNAPMASTAAWRQADIPAANGHGNARSVARIQAVVANGGTLDGVELLSPETVRRIFEVQADGKDLVLGTPTRFGMGYALANDSMPFGTSDTVCFWGGWGGSLVLVDTARRMTFSYIMNKMAPRLFGDMRAPMLALRIYDALD